MGVTKEQLIDIIGKSIKKSLPPTLSLQTRVAMISAAGSIMHNINEYVIELDEKITVKELHELHQKAFSVTVPIQMKAENEKNKEGKAGTS